MPLDPDALMVRGGSNRDASVTQELILEAVEDGDGPVLSVFCSDPLDGESRADHLLRICRAAGIPHGKVQVGRVGDLDGSGIELVHETASDQGECHYHVVLSDDVPLSQVEALIGVLGEPEVNPTGGKRKRT